MCAKRHRIPPAQMQRVRKLRRESTFPERLLWSKLRRSALLSLKFRKQAAIGSFIVDFYCPRAALVIEVDGISHDGRAAYDAERMRDLESKGLRVLRYTNDEILDDVDAVAEDIARQVGLKPPPSPTPP